MKPLESHETLLKGSWIMCQGRVVVDETSQRIEGLIQNHLKFITRDPTGWDALYRDENDERLWELSYPESELHGAGPLQLRSIPSEEAIRKFRAVV